VKKGDRVKVKLVERDERGRLRLSMKALLPKPDGVEAAEGSNDGAEEEGGDAERSGADSERGGDRPRGRRPNRGPRRGGRGGRDRGERGDRD
jgi:polyribonucleotide nucleotidyltransferase